MELIRLYWLAGFSAEGTLKALNLPLSLITTAMYLFEAWDRGAAEMTVALRWEKTE